MAMKELTTLFVGLIMATFCATLAAQEPKPYKDGQVTYISYIKIKPGKFDDYMKWLDGPYKTLMEANKKAGLITGYAVYSATAHTPQEPDLILTVTYANMAALDKIDEADAVAAKVWGSNDAQNKAYADRGVMREAIGSQLVRELVLK
jgi:hypothetical protein